MSIEYDTIKVNCDQCGDITEGYITENRNASEIFCNCGYWIASIRSKKDE
jgi:hypothetical protein